MSFTKVMNTNMDKISCKNMTSWGLGAGTLPVTTDPENPFKPFATYSDADDKKDEVSKTPEKRSKTT